jgi:hypothetical protein
VAELDGVGWCCRGGPLRETRLPSFILTEHATMSAPFYSGGSVTITSRPRTASARSGYCAGSLRFPLAVALKPACQAVESGWRSDETKAARRVPREDRPLTGVATRFVQNWMLSLSLKRSDAVGNRNPALRTLHPDEVAWSEPTCVIKSAGFEGEHVLRRL